MKRVIITPLDVIHFRSSRPFYKGENFIAQQGDITPLPFAGAIRSKLLSITASGDIPFDWYNTDKHPEFKEIVDAIGTPSSEGKIRLFGTYPADPSKNELFPCPNDVVKSERDESSKIFLNPMQSDLFKIGEYHAVASGQNGSFYIKDHGGFITLSGLKTYLSGNIPSANEFVSKDKIMLEERRVGIEIDRDKRTTKERMFYSVDYIRLNDGFAFSVWVNGSFDLPAKGLLKIGGEGRAASYEVSNGNKFKFSEIIKEANKNRRFKLYLSTPAVFLGENGINACAPNPERLREKLGVSVKLVSMLPGKPMRLGGWDMAAEKGKGKQKPLRHAMRSGAVYFYEITDGKIDENIEMPIMISDVVSWLGLGSAFIGRW